MPILLDPINGKDMKLIRVGAGGLIESSRICKGLDKKRVDATVDCYGLNLPRLRDARLEVMRQVSEMIDTLIDDADVGDKVADDDVVKLNLLRKSNTVTERALPKSEYSLAARAVLSAKFPELLPDLADYAA